MSRREAWVSETGSEIVVGNETVSVLMRNAGLPVDEERLAELAGLLEAARNATLTLNDAAERVQVSDALAVFDPAWPRQGRDS
jgi:hypothetical protein